MKKLTYRDAKIVSETWQIDAGDKELGERGGDHFKDVSHVVRD